MAIDQNPNSVEPIKTIIVCKHCQQKIRIPQSKRRLRVTCPNCHREFRYRYYGLGLSSFNIKTLFLSLIGSLIGFVFVDILFIVPPAPLWSHFLLAFILILLGITVRAALVYRRKLSVPHKLGRLESASFQILLVIAGIGLLPLFITCVIGFTYNSGGGKVYRGCINKISHVGELPNLRNIRRIEAK